MCFFHRKKKKKEEAERQAKAVATAKALEEKKKEEVASEVASEELKTKEGAFNKTTVENQGLSKTEEKESLVQKPVAKEKVTKEKSTSRYSGKYEIYPEAGLFKYRLKASNGEILLVSGGYTSRQGAVNGIKTLQKNISLGQSSIVTDKNGFAQFRITTSNGARTILSGEFYEKAISAEAALASTKKFAAIAKLVQLEEIPPEEVREELVEAKPVEANANGKVEVTMLGGKWQGTLKASNGEILFVTDTYASKKSLLVGLASIKAGVDKGIFRINRDKQGRYQFRLYSAINQLLLVGETYGKKEAALSAAESVRRFVQQAKIVESDSK